MTRTFLGSNEDSSLSRRHLRIKLGAEARFMNQISKRIRDLWLICLKVMRASPIDKVVRKKMNKTIKVKTRLPNPLRLLKNTSKSTKTKT